MVCSLTALILNLNNEKKNKNVKENGKMFMLTTIRFTHLS